MSNTKTLPFEITFSLGDVSGDGHEKSAEYIFATSHDKIALEAAYEDTVKKTGLDLGDICRKFEDNNLDIKTQNILTQHGVDLSFIEDTQYADAPSDISVSATEFAELMLRFIKISLPSLEFTAVEPERTYFMPQRQFGYGLF